MIAEYGKAPRSAEEAAVRDVLEEDFDSLRDRLREFTYTELVELYQVAANLTSFVNLEIAVRNANRRA